MSRIARVPVVIHVHGAEFSHFYNRSPHLLRHYIRVTLEMADAVVALGDTWAAALQTIAPRASISVVSNAVAPAAAVRQPPPGEALNVLFLGEVEERKGAFLLLQAWGEFTRLPLPIEVNLVLAGGGAVARARRMVEELGIADQVRLTDWVPPERVESLLAESHVLVLPSNFEGQPMAVLEAMARGLCVVATDVGGIPDLVGDCGVLVPAGDVASLVAALCRVTQDNDLREQLGAGALRRVEECFDVNSTWKTLDSLYRQLTP
jgi:glycosyltransferase involved in cell wall biosynthesis